MGCVVNHLNARVEGEQVLEHSAEGIQSVAVQSDNGHIEVAATADSAGNIQIEARIEVAAPNEDEALIALDHVEITAAVDESTGGLEIDWRWDDDQRRRDVAVSVSYHLTVPPAMDVRLTSHNGYLETSGPIGNCRASSRNGHIKIAGGDTSATSLSAETHNGRLTIATPASKIKLETYNGRVEANLTSLAPTGSIESHNGALQIQLDPAVSVKLACEAHNGSVAGQALPEPERFDGPRRNRRSATLGEGEGTLRIETHNGQIRVDWLGEIDDDAVL